NAYGLWQSILKYTNTGSGNALVIGTERRSGDGQTPLEFYFSKYRLSHIGLGVGIVFISDRYGFDIVEIGQCIRTAKYDEKHLMLPGKCIDHIHLQFTQPKIPGGIF